MNDNVWYEYVSKSQFCVFKSILTERIYIIYIINNSQNNTNNLISYDLIFNIKVNEIKNPHDKIITDIRHLNSIFHKIELTIK